MKKLLLFSLLSLAIPMIAMQPSEDLSQYSGYEGFTPLMNAIYQRPNYEEIKALLDAGADINAKDAKGRTAIWYAAYRSKLQYDNSYPSDIYDILLARGANPNIASTSGDFAGKTAQEIRNMSKEEAQNIRNTYVE